MGEQEWSKSTPEGPHEQGNIRDYRKLCTLCDQPRNVLVRCQIDDTGRWHFVCPGSCWKNVSGGKIDGDGAEEHQFYRYGGMWKNKNEAVSAKKPKSKRRQGRPSTDSQYEEASGVNIQDVEPWNGNACEYIKNDKVIHENLVWICRRSHFSNLDKDPKKTYRLWKEQEAFVEDPK